MVQGWDFKKQAIEFEILEQIKANGIGSETRAFLEDIRKGKEGVAFKKQVLSEFFLNIAQTERVFEADEKDFLFAYFKEFISDVGAGFLFSDRVLARLVKENDADRNAEIVALMEKREKIEGFFEETAAKLVTVKPDLCTTLAKRAMGLCQESDKPKGVVFALALLEQEQVKLAVALLIELAKKGAATAALMYFTRILAKAKGAEKLLADMLLVNLSRLCKTEQSVLREYTATLYLAGAEAFYDNKAELEAARILRAERMVGLIGGNNELREKYIMLINRLVAKDKRFKEVFSRVSLTAYVAPSVDRESVPSIAPKTQVAESKKESVLPQVSEVKAEERLKEADAAADVLKITSEEVAQHFEEIKRLSKDAVARAEFQAKGNAKNSGERALKLKMLAKKIKLFKKDEN
ncbi:MAG: hypothetical protein J6B00_03480 [Alphaproteobacteria bacterium]|nr:hypothetical protein [Alphaproteobacteria bacterium]